MATQIFTNAGLINISALINDIRQGRLILQPEFQRNLVWNDKHKESFIDTILKGFPFPEIYIAQSGVDFESLQTQQVVVDGQQRLSTIIKYVEGKLVCKTISTFNNLSIQEKTDFLGYGVSVKSLGSASSETIKEVFRRINQTQYSLNPIEIQNAYYDGEFISTAKEILDGFNIEVLPVFSETDTARMVDLNFILLLMATHEEGGYFSGDKKTEDYIICFNDNYANKDVVKQKFNKILHTIVEMQLSNDSMWFRKSNFFTLFSEIAKLEDIPIYLKERLATFETFVINAKNNPETEFGKYYSAMYTGTNSRTSRLVRGNLFKKYVIDCIELD